MALELEKQLFTACKNGWLGVVKNLVSNRNVDLSCRDEDGNIPLHLACLYGHAAIVRFLTINKRCDAENRNYDGDTPINYAALKGHLSIVKLLVDDIRCHPTVKGRLGRTPLHDVCSQGHLHVVKYLIDEVGVDPLCQDDKTGATPLHLACQCGHSDIVRYLEKHIDECRDNDGNTPLHYAALHGHLNIVQLLVDECHCDPMCKGQYERTPLHSACQEGHLNVVQYLMDKQPVHASHQDVNNVTPLHFASLRGHTEVVKYLVGVKKCDPAPRTGSGAGETPYDWAHDKGHMDIALYLEGQGGGPSGALHVDDIRHNPKINCQPGRTPLYSACHGQEGPIVAQKPRPTVPDSPTNTASAPTSPPRESDMYRKPLGGKPDLADAFRITFPVAREWKSIGVLLNIQPHWLGDIETAQNRVPTDCLREMLSAWLTQIDPPPTWKSLADVVKMMNPAVAQKIEQKYLTP